MAAPGRQGVDFSGSHSASFMNTISPKRQQRPHAGRLQRTTPMAGLSGARLCVSFLLWKVQILGGWGGHFCQAGTSSNQSEVEASVTTGSGW